MSVKVTIVVPVYNISNYIERCFASIVQQDNHDIECIMVDDVSTDDSFAKCERLVAGYTGPIDFKLIKHTKNRGLSASRNTGTVHSSGEYIYYLDGDDEITPNCISSLVAIAQKYPEADFVQGMMQTSPYDESYDLSKYDFYGELYDGEWLRKEIFQVCKRLHVTSTDKLIRKQFLIANNLEFKEGLIHEDQLWMFYVLKYVKYIAFSKTNTYIYHINPNSIITRMNKKGHIESWGEILSDVVLHIDGSYRREQVFTYLHIYLNRINELVKYDKFQRLHDDFIRELKFLREYTLIVMMKYLRKTKLEYERTALIDSIQTCCKTGVSPSWYWVVKYKLEMLRIKLSIGKYFK